MILCIVWWIQPIVQEVVMDNFLDANHTPNNLPLWKGRVADDLFQALDNPLTHLD